MSAEQQVNKLIARCSLLNTGGDVYETEAFKNQKSNDPFTGWVPRNQK